MKTCAWDMLMAGPEAFGVELWDAKAEANSAPADVVRLDAGQAAAWAKESPAIVLDLRTAEEFNPGHLEGAMPLDFQTPGFEDELRKLNRGNAYLVHCRSGRRSEGFLAVFGKPGFMKVGHLEGGLVAWNRAGLPLAKGSRPAFLGRGFHSTPEGDPVLGGNGPRGRTSRI